MKSLLSRFSPILSALLLAPASPARCAPPQSDTSRWKEDFSNPEALSKHWSVYGFLAAGISEKNPLGQPVGAKGARPDWWQIVDGSLRGQNFPEEKHGPGISRSASGQDVRLSCRFKIPSEGMAGVGIRGPNPIVERDFSVASLHIRCRSIVAADNDVLHPKGSPAAEELKKNGTWNRKFFYAKKEEIQITPDAWHSLILEVRGKELTVWIDEKQVLQYTTLCGDVPKTSVGFGVGGHHQRVLASWYDDVHFEPLEPKTALSAMPCPLSP